MNKKALTQSHLAAILKLAVRNEEEERPGLYPNQGVPEKVMPVVTDLSRRIDYGSTIRTIVKSSAQWAWNRQCDVLLTLEEKVDQ
jgi:hypothetical protein